MVGGFFMKRHGKGLGFGIWVGCVEAGIARKGERGWLWGGSQDCMYVLPPPLPPPPFFWGGVMCVYVEKIGFLVNFVFKYSPPRSFISFFYLYHSYIINSNVFQPHLFILSRILQIE